MYRKYIIEAVSLVSRPSRVFNVAHVKSGRSGQSGDVIGRDCTHINLCDSNQIVLSSDPTLCEEKGLAHFEQFLADSACDMNYALPRAYSG